MANEFRPWIDDANVSDSNVQPGSTFIADSQRQNGFAAGQPASSTRVNTALREATLVATALVNLLGQSADLFSAQSTLSEVQTAFASYFGQDVVGVSYNSVNNTLTINFKNGGSQMVPLPSPEAATEWYEGTDVVYISEGDYYTISKSSYPAIKLNDLYLVSETYTSGDQEIKVGDIFKVTYENPASVEVQKQLNIAGPQGPAGQNGQPGQDGQRGTLWFEGSDLEDDSGAWWDERTFPSGYQPDIGDLYLLTSTYTDGSITFNKGDVYKVDDLGPGGAVMQFVCNIAVSERKYVHNIKIKQYNSLGSNTMIINCVIITDNSQAYTYTSLASWLYNDNHNRAISCSGGVVKSDGTFNAVSRAITANSATAIQRIMVSASSGADSQSAIPSTAEVQDYIYEL